MGYGNIASGEFKSQELYVASNDAESVPNGTLTLDVLNLLDTEGNGLTATGVGNNCTTNSELAEEGGVGCGSVGEFSEDAFIQIAHKAAVGRSEGRRVGKGWCSTCRSRWGREPY